MPAEAWVALGIGLAGIAGTIIWAVWALGGKLASVVTRFELVVAQQALEIKEIKVSVENLKEVISIVAVQKDQIQSLRETQAQNAKRTDETFTRIFAILDGLRIPTNRVG